MSRCGDSHRGSLVRDRGSGRGILGVAVIELGRIDELADHFHGGALAGTGRDARSAHEIHALLLAEGAHDNLELRVGEDTGHGKGTGRHVRNQRAGAKKAVDRVRSDGHAAAAKTFGKRVDTHRRNRAGAA